MSFFFLHIYSPLRAFIILSFFFIYPFLPLPRLLCSLPHSLFHPLPLLYLSHWFTFFNGSHARISFLSFSYHTKYLWHVLTSPHVIFAPRFTPPIIFWNNDERIHTLYFLPHVFTHPSPVHVFIFFITCTSTRLPSSAILYILFTLNWQKNIEQKCLKKLF